MFFFLGERIEDGKKNLKAYDMKLYKILGGHEIGGVVSVIYIYIYDMQILMQKSLAITEIHIRSLESRSRSLQDLIDQVGFSGKFATEIRCGYLLFAFP